MLTVGIVGLPNVGKSTLFAALTRAEARISNYPFTTIDSNHGVAEVPDRRLWALSERLAPSETIPCFVDFIDIAGLVEGASRGEGLGNQFLGNIRAVDAVVHVLRCFEQPDVAHVYEEIDPVHDAGVVETELLLADLEVLTRSIEKRGKTWKAEPTAHVAEREFLQQCREALEAGRPLRELELEPEDARRLKALGMITSKPTLYLANLSEDEGADGAGERLDALRRGLSAPGPVEVLGLSAQLELELAGLEEAERREFMSVLGLERSGLERLVERAFERLGLIRFYTVANDKLRAWEIPRGTPARSAAGRVHTDMEAGFIRAEVVSAEELIAAGSWQELRHQGRCRTEGKEYEVRDGDVLEVLFSRS